MRSAPILILTVAFLGSAASYAAVPLPAQEVATLPQIPAVDGEITDIKVSPDLSRILMAVCSSG